MMIPVPQYPEPVVGMYILNNKSDLFLFKSPKWNGKWVVPGGHIEWGETAQEAVIRETKEETGLSVSDIEFLCYYESMPTNTEFYKSKHMVFLDFRMLATSSSVTLNNEGTEYQWIKPKEALKLDLESFTRKTIEKYLLR